jgi:hypothetical protein
MYRDATNVEPEMYNYTSNNWSTGIVTRSLRKNLEAVPGKHSIDSLQKTAILIIIIIILGIFFMQCIHTYIPETNHVPREHCVATILM